jgi:acyl carrier protein
MIQIHISRQNAELWLIERLSSLLDLSPAEIDEHASFAEYGLDSATAIGLSDEVARWLGQDFSPTLFYEYPSIASLAEYVASLTEPEPTAAHFA